MKAIAFANYINGDWMHHAGGSTFAANTSTTPARPGRRTAADTQTPLPATPWPLAVIIAPAPQRRASPP